MLDEEGGNRMPKRTGYREEFGELLRTERRKVTAATSAAMVRSALVEVRAGGGADDLRTTDLRHENSNWILGYHESPFRAISSYEAVRDASYYLLSVDLNGFIVSGRSVAEELERRKLNGSAANHGSVKIATALMNRASAKEPANCDRDNRQLYQPADCVRPHKNSV